MYKILGLFKTTDFIITSTCFKKSRLQEVSVPLQT